MTSEEQTTLRNFETRVRQLMLKYKELENKNRELQVLVEEKEVAMSAILEENKTLRSEYANLKLAKMIEIGDDDLKEAKTRVTKLVKEIDKCIALLNV
ncbi:MAG: hypothetical protein J6C15_10250 [Bacteroidaceae bacterium]|nr:hypothetical protein [Bacteroidaceae bacterium]